MCRFDEAKRREWGCDEETREYQDVLPCPRCSGKDSECEICEGQMIAIHRCLSAVVPGEWREFMTVCEWADRGVMPVSGGLGDQTDWFVRWFEIWRSEKAKVDEVVEERRRQEAENAR